MAHKFNYNTVVLSEEEYEALLKDRVKLNEVKHNIEEYISCKVLELDKAGRDSLRNNLIIKLYDIFDL